MIDPTMHMPSDEITALAIPAPTIAAMSSRLVADGADPTSVQALAGMILDRLSYDSHGQATVVDAAGRPQVDDMGQPVSVSAMMAAMRQNLPQFWASKGAVTSAPPANETQTARAVRIATERRDRADASKAAGPNPWVSGNITQQVAMQARDPQRAARLRAEAGAR